MHCPRNLKPIIVLVTETLFKDSLTILINQTILGKNFISHKVCPYRKSRNFDPYTKQFNCNLSPSPCHNCHKVRRNYPLGQEVPRGPSLSPEEMVNWQWQM